MKVGVVAAAFAVCTIAAAGVRDRQWERVREAVEQGRPRTALEALAPIARSALKERAYAEATRAILQRVALESASEGNRPEEKVTRLEAEIGKAPEPMRPVMEAILARWMWQYFQQNRWRILSRSRTALPTGGDITSWDLSRIYREIDARFARALSADDLLKRTPIADWDALLERGTAPDPYRPTLYDFVAAEALDFYTSGEQVGARPEDAFEVAADGPIFAPVDEFTRWSVTTPDSTSPAFRAIRLYQELLRFHATDADPSARIDVDLARLRFGRNQATGPEKTTRCMAALEQLAERSRSHELSSRVLSDHAAMLHALGDLPAAWTVARRGADRFPESVGGRECYNLVQRIEAKALSISTERVWNSPPPAIQVRYRNLSRVYFRVVPFDFEAWVAQGHDSPERPDASRLGELLAREPVLAWSEEVQGTPDFRERLERLPTPTGLAPGFYYLIASDTGNFTTTDHPVQAAAFWVSTLALVLRHESKGIEGFVLDASTGTPIVGAQVQAWLGDWRSDALEGPLAISDRDGRFRIPSTGRINVVLASHSGQRLASRDPMWPHDPSDPQLRESTLLFTDRGLYRPGQTVRYKGLCVLGDPAKDRYEVLPQRTLALVFRDGNGREIARQEHRTNDYGSFSGSFTVPRDRLLGHMSLTVDGGPSGSVRISAEEYKRPRFVVALEAPTAAARLGEEVSLRGTATAYTGAAVDGAEVRWRVVRTVRYSPWCQWRFPQLDRYAPGQEIAHGTATTGADGSFRMSFLARPDPAASEETEPAFVFAVHADVTDRAGETRPAERRVVVGYTALAATLSADAWQVVTKPAEIVLRTVSLDGVPIPSAGELIIDRLRQPARAERAGLADRSSDVWRDRTLPAVSVSDSSYGPDPATWPADQAVFRRTLKTDTTGAATIAARLPAGVYRARFDTHDRFGKRVTAELPLRVLDPRADRCPILVPDLLSAPTWSVEPGDEFVAVWGSGYPEARAYIEVEHRGRMLQAFWTAPGRTQLVVRQPVDEAMRGGFMVRVTMVHENRAYLHEQRVEVPWSNKQLVLRWEHFVSKLEPGAHETWTAVITGRNAKRAVAEMVATLYDASLDAFRPHPWPAGFDAFRQEHHTRGARFENATAVLWTLAGRWQVDSRPVSLTYRAFPAQVMWDWHRHGGRLWLGLDDPRRPGIEVRSEKRIDSRSSTTTHSISADKLKDLPVDNLREAVATKAGVVTQGGELFFRGGRSGEVRFDGATVRALAGPGASPAQGPDLGRVAARRNLEETAFFFPHLVSDARGEVRMSFTMPEALTEWRFLGFAHDRDLRAGLIEARAVTTRDLMVQPNPPRFLREGDTLEFIVRVTNLSDRRQVGRVRLTLSDAATRAPADEAVNNLTPAQPFDVPARESRVHAWRLAVSDGTGMLTYKAVASTGRQSDGEEGHLPVLPRRVLVTESLPLPIRGAQTRAFDFARLRLSGTSPTLRHQSLTLQMVSHPSWYAIMALPYLMESSHECVERTFNRLYANALARHVASSDPKIARVFELWRATPALDSPLEQDRELKAVLLEETPWLRQAWAESQARRDVGILFDRNRLDDETVALERRLADQQLSDGAWPWFPGGRPNDYMTLYIATGFGRLRHLGVKVGTGPALRALERLDAWVEGRNRAALAHGEGLSPTIVLYLYARSFFLKDRAPSPTTRKAIDYWLAQGRRYWLTLPGRQSQAQLALALARFGDRATARDIMRSLHERASRSEELGMFWRDDEHSWWWYRAPIETQAVLIEAFQEVTGDSAAVEDCKVWLLKQKQTQDWKTSKATADAIYALLLRGMDLLGSDVRVDVSLGGQVARPDAVQAGTGFYERRFVGREITPELAAVSVRKTDAGVSWGSLHWQYLEHLSEVTAYAGTPLTLRKSLYTRQASTRGPVLEPVNGPIRVGDELVVRIELRVDRDMEYVHLRDHRASGVEPTQVLSGYRYQDGLRYYESTRDMASHFFIDYLPKGVYVFEYPTRVQHRGRYVTGMAQIQCMYAPEFNSHSGSVDLDVR